MPLVTVRDVFIQFGRFPVLDGVSCLIEAGQRIGLLGRNGEGKTTFLRLLSGDIEPENGEVAFAPGTRVALLTQDIPQHVPGTVRDVVASAFSAAGHDPIPAWDAEQRVNHWLARMELPADRPFAELSSGMKRRVLLARALVTGPDLLLLDEPTNHLDMEAITWLEDFLGRWQGTLMFVTHDRVFLQKLAKRILEIDRGRLFDWSCDYETFLSRKEAALAAEEKQNLLFDKKLAEEEVWIRKGIQARRTRNEGRVRALEEMRRKHRERRETKSQVQMSIQEAQRSGTLVAELDDVSYRYGDRYVFQDFSTTIMRGDKLGIVGPNGAGKTTLLRVLLGELPPTSGSVRLGTNLQVAYFDQLRQQLNEEASVQDNVADGYDTVQVNGSSRHVIGYLRDFLFEPDRARTLVKFLSGGERNRVLLARLFAKPANVIVLDEPTNDLDIETLEMLEERLVQFQGTVLLVSHDRAFLNNVVTSTIVFEPQGLKEYVGGYDDWLRQRGGSTMVSKAGSSSAGEKRASKSSADRSAPSPGKRRLSYKEQQELQSLPSLIERIEGEIHVLHEELARPEFYRQSAELIAQCRADLKQLEERLAAAYRRWEELESWAS